MERERRGCKGGTLLLRRIFRTVLHAGVASACALASSCSTTGLEDELGLDDTVEEEQDVESAPDVWGPRRDGGPQRLDASRPVRRDAARPTDARVLLDARLDAPDRGDAGARGGLRCPGDSNFPAQAAGLRPLQPYDYVALREAAQPAGAVDAGGERWSSTLFLTLSEAGSRCARAVGPACAEKLAYHPLPLSNPSCKEYCYERAVVTTRGDEVRRWASTTELLSLLGPIDSSDEALLIVSSRGFGLSCDDPEHGSVRELGEGYEVVATRTISLCPMRAELVRLEVTREGEIAILSRTLLPADDAPCIGTTP